MIVVNGRCLRGTALTGVQRYTQEILARWNRASFRFVAPPEQLSRGMTGHFWEQAFLPFPRRSNKDLIWSPANSGPILPKRHVATIHDIFPITHPQWTSKSFVRAYSFILPKMAGNCLHVIAVSQDTRQTIIERLGVKEENVTAIYNGVSDHFFLKLGDQAVEAELSKFGLRVGEYVLTVGTIEPRKNLRTLLNAWKKIEASSNQKMKLVIAGGQGSARVFGGLSFSQSEFKSLQILGHVSDQTLHALYTGARVFCYPSLYEGFGIPVLEAMASGVPVVCGSGGGLAEISRKGAIVVDTKSEKALAEGLAAILDNDRLRAQLSIEGAEWAKNFTWDRASSQTFSLLEKLSV